MRLRLRDSLLWCGVWTAAVMFRCGASVPSEPALVLEKEIPLGEVRGRMDHFAIDEQRGRLFIAELGNDSVGVIDLRAQSLLRRIEGVEEPQGLSFLPAEDTLIVASGGDGAVHLFTGEDLAASGTIELGSDADNVRFDPVRNRVYVGYGTGAIAVIDPARRAKIGEFPLRGHPEGFQLDPDGGRIAVNVPGSGETAVVDLATGEQTESWKAEPFRANFPMAIDPETGRVLVAYRNPPRLVAFGEGGDVEASLETCGDADDVFADSGRDRVYVSCGEGVVDVFERSGKGYARISRVPTGSGARTSFLLPGGAGLVVAVPGRLLRSAAIWLFRFPPSP